MKLLDASFYMFAISRDHAFKKFSFYLPLCSACLELKMPYFSTVLLMAPQTSYVITYMEL